MKRVFVICAVIVGAVALAAERPTELPMWQRLNGEPTRAAQADGGGQLLFSSDGGVASVAVTGGNVYKIECPNYPTHICVGPADGGCNATAADPNFGDLVAAGSSLYVITQRTTTTIAAFAADGGANVLCPVFLMK